VTRQALQQWWLFAIVVYIVQVRPETRDDTIADYDLKGWWGLAVDSKATLDAHYVKGKPIPSSRLRGL